MTFDKRKYITQNFKTSKELHNYYLKREYEILKDRDQMNLLKGFDLSFLANRKHIIFNCPFFLIKDIKHFIGVGAKTFPGTYRTWQKIPDKWAEYINPFIKDFNKYVMDNPWLNFLY